MTQPSGSLFRGLNWVMVPLFLVATVVQWNDPDSARWMAIYGAAFAVCVVVVLGRPLPMAAPVLVGFIALAWGLATMAAGPAGTSYSHMFDAWKMQEASVEQAREASGLLMVAGWMLVVVLRGRRDSGRV